METRPELASWAHFSGLVAAELELEYAVDHESRLLADLEFDSFALLQLAALLWDLGEVDFPEHFDLSTLTLGECYEWY